MEPEKFESDHRELFDALNKQKGTCPDVDLLHSYLWGGLSAGEEDEFKEHLSLCGVCRELVDRLQQSDEPFDERSWENAERRLEERAAPWRESAKSVDRPVGRSVYWITAAASLVLAIGGLFLWRLTDTLPTDNRPGSATRGPIVQIHEPVGMVNYVRIFTWSSLPVAARFHLQIRQQGQVVWEAQVAESHYRPPDELSAILVPGVRFEWRVAAQDDAGRPVGESSWMGFELLP